MTRLTRSNRYLAAGAHFAAIELLYVRRDLAKMENQIPELIVVLEKIATDVGATTPIVTDGKKGNFLSNKFASISIGSKSKEGVDYTADNRAAYLMLKGAMLKSLNRVCGFVQFLRFVSNPYLKGSEAIACFKEVYSLENSLKEKYYIPYSLYELAESLYHSNNIKEAQVPPFLLFC